MKKLFSLSSFLNQQITVLPKNINLTFQNKFYARTTKRKQNKPQQQKKQQPNKEAPQETKNVDNSQAQEQDNFQSDKQAKKQIHITGPKRMIHLMKKGNTNIIPYYIKAFKNPIRNFPLPFKKQLKQENEQKVQFSSQNKQQETQKKQQSSSKIKISIKIRNNSVQEQRPNKNQQPKEFKINYPYKSSQKYQQKLLKKYKIIQAIKSKRITYSNRLAFDWRQWRQLTFNQLFGNTHYRGIILRLTALTCFTLFIVFQKALSLQDQNPQPIFTTQKSNQISLAELQNKIRNIKQINVQNKPDNKAGITLVLNQKRNLTSVQKLMDSLGFEVQQNRKVKFQVQNPNILLDGLQKVQQNIDHKEWIKIKPIQPKYSYYDAFFDTLFLATPFIGIAITYWIFTKMNPESLMKGITSNKKSMKIQSTKDIKVRFKDVAGMENAKKQITQFVDFLKKSQKYVQMGAKIPKGALLTGPPGTGKTMLAKACAGQAGTSFFYVSGSQFVEMFVGLGASRVRQLFARARAEAPSIIFIDQIDAIGKKRQTSRNEEKDSTLNQMLVQMDGFSSSQTVIVLAATNRKDILDSALTRPGRFDRVVEITLPEIKARQQIFMVHLGPLKVNPNKPLTQLAKRLAQLTPGFSGADIANLCNQAAIIATRKKRNYIEDDDFEEASERIMAGYIKKGLSNQKTKKRVAYHEAGHAVCGWFLRGGDPLVKLTIIPRSKGALGYAQYLPKTAYIRTRSQLIDQIAIMLGGTTSEQVFLGNMSSGNSDDLQKVYGVARRMIAQFGMGSQTYNMTLDEQTYVKKQSQKLCNVMDKQILQVVNQASKRAKNIIEQKRDIVQQLTKQLLQKQTINDADILRIMGERPVFA